MDFVTELRGVAKFTYPATHGLLMAQAADKMEELEAQLRDAQYHNELLVSKINELEKTIKKLHEQKLFLAKKLQEKKRELSNEPHNKKHEPFKNVSTWAIENGYN